VSRGERRGWSEKGTELPGKKEGNGGPDRDRTDDLFHAMIGVMGQIIDGTVLTNRHNRQN
jgi:hypothetical protein